MNNCYPYFIVGCLSLLFFSSSLGQNTKKFSGSFEKTPFSQLTGKIEAASGRIFITRHFSILTHLPSNLTDSGRIRSRSADQELSPIPDLRNQLLWSPDIRTAGDGKKEIWFAG